MAPASRPFLVRELLWLLSILLAAVPLSIILHGLLERVPMLAQSLRQVLSTPGYVALALYLVMVLSCYLGRLGAFGAARLAQAIAQEARLPRPA